MKKTVFALLLLWTCVAHAQAPFYQGKTITMIVGTKSSDVYDFYARLLAEHLPRHIPGKPGIIVQNMPGAASLIATNYLYNVAKPDGLTIGAIFPALYLDQLSKRSEVKFDWTKLSWIGSTARSNHLLYVRADTPFKTFDDLRTATVPLKCGATGRTSSAFYLTRLFEETMGAKIEQVAGYQAGADVDLAVERGEVQCRAFTIASFHSREPFVSWRNRGFVRVLVQTGVKRDERLPDAPTIYELMDRYKTPDSARRFAKATLAAGDFGRPIVAPPGVPADRVKILREAFDRTLKDPEFLADAKKRKLEIDPVGGEELAALAREVIAVSPEIAAKVRELLGQ